LDRQVALRGLNDLENITARRDFSHLNQDSAFILRFAMQ